MLSACRVDLELTGICFWLLFKVLVAFEGLCERKEVLGGVDSWNPSCYKHREMQDKMKTKSVQWLELKR